MRFLSAASSLREENTGTRVASLWLATDTSYEVWSSRYTVSAFVEAGFSCAGPGFIVPPSRVSCGYYHPAASDAVVFQRDLA